jgi:hypothetical protein
MFRLDLGKCATTRKRHKRSTPGTRPAMNRHRASGGMPGNRQGLQVQPGGGGRVEAALSVHPHGAPCHRLSQGISPALASQRFWLAVSALHDRRFEVTSESPAGGARTQHGVTIRESDRR